MDVSAVSSSYVANACLLPSPQSFLLAAGRRISRIFHQYIPDVKGSMGLIDEKEASFRFYTRLADENLGPVKKVVAHLSEATFLGARLTDIRCGSKPEDQKEVGIVCKLTPCPIHTAAAEDGMEVVEVAREAEDPVRFLLDYFEIWRRDCLVAKEVFKFLNSSPQCLQNSRIGTLIQRFFVDQPASGFDVCDPSAISEFLNSYISDVEIVECHAKGIISNMEEPNALYLVNNPIVTDRLFEVLTKMLPHLETLCVFMCQNLHVVKGLERLSALKSLSVEQTAVSEVASFCHLSGLEEMDLQNNAHLRELPSMEQLCKLKRLRINFCPIKKLPSLHTCRSLSNLDLSHCAELEQVEGIEHLSSLTSLDFAMTDNLRYLPTFRNLRNLKDLSFFHSGFPVAERVRICQELYEAGNRQVYKMKCSTTPSKSDSGTKRMACYINDNEVSLGCLRELRDKSIDEIVEFIEVLGPDLTFLSFYETTSSDLEQRRNLTDGHLKRIAKSCPNLTYFRLAHNENISNEGMRSITNLKHLRTLDLCFIEKLSEIGPFPQTLESLAIFACPLETVASFKGLTQLKELRLQGEFGVGCQLKELPVFDDLTNLKSLSLEHFWLLAEIPSLAACRELTCFSLQFCPNVCKIAGIQDCTELTSVTIEFCERLGSFPSAACLTKLASFKATHTALTMYDKLRIRTESRGGTMMGNFPHFFSEGKEGLVLSGQGHRVAGKNPVQYRGMIVSADGRASYNWQEAVEGVLDNLRNALEKAGKGRDLAQLTNVTVYFVEKKQVPFDQIMMYCYQFFGKMPAMYVPVDDLTEENIVEIEGAIEGNPTRAVKLNYYAAQGSDLDQAFQAALKEARSDLLKMSLALSNISHVGITLHDTSLFPKLNDIWNAYFPEGSRPPARTITFDSRSDFARFTFRAHPQAASSVRVESNG